MRKIVVDKKLNEKKLNSVIQYHFKNLGMNNIYKALRKKDIKINGKRVSENVIVYEKDEIEVYITDDILYNLPKIEKVYEDSEILLVNKPDNMEVVGENSLTSILANEYTYISPCHRLDRNTKGIVLFAKNEKTLNMLMESFKNHEIEKHYVCMVYGIPKKSEAVLTDYLFKDAKKSQVYILSTPKTGYQKIITEYKVLQKNNDNTCILDVNLHTGRTHQIRAHLAYIGYPIIGDGKYGKNDINKKFGVKTQKLMSYKIKFNFKQNMEHLEYLNNKEFEINYSNL